MRLAIKIGDVEGFMNPGGFAKRFGIKSIVRGMAFERLEPFGFPIENRHHIHAAMFAKMEKPETFGHQHKRGGPMTADEVARKNREAGHG